VVTFALFVLIVFSAPGYGAATASTPKSPARA
jgi:hypothetical protein